MRAEDKIIINYVYFTCNTHIKDNNNKAQVTASKRTCTVSLITTSTYKVAKYEKTSLYRGVSQTTTTRGKPCTHSTTRKTYLFGYTNQITEFNKSIKL